MAVAGATMGIQYFYCAKRNVIFRLVRVFLVRWNDLFDLVEKLGIPQNCVVYLLEQGLYKRAGKQNNKLAYSLLHTLKSIA